MRSAHPVYAEVLGGPEGTGIRFGIEQAVCASIESIERGRRLPGETAEVWRRLGEAEFQAGRSLEALRAAYRTGTRAAWRGAAEVAAAAGVSAPAVIALAEAIFVYTDELSAGVADGAGAWLVIPDPDGPGRRAALRRAVARSRAALGPTVAPRSARRSLHWARLTLELVGRGVLPDDQPTRTSDHLATVILLQDVELARALVSERLAGLEALSAGDRERLTETLAAWLAHQRHTPGIAAELNVHPQTVRYRVGQPRELLCDAMETPQGRFELELALRVRRAVG